jgi:hypothetical protein
MSSLNCWEVKNCGREPGGSKITEFGVCPAASVTKVNGLNHGKNGGRVCWALTGTYCGGKVQGSYAIKLGNCMDCEFYKTVRNEEGKNLINSMQILSRLNS